MKFLTVLYSILQFWELQDASTSPPRLAMYVQTFHDEAGNPLSLLPLQNTSVTHVILAALHLNAPGVIHLNDQPPNSSTFDHVWSDVKTLQEGGIKVMAMMGGAAMGSYTKLCGGDNDTVRTLRHPHFRRLLTFPRSSTPTMNLFSTMSLTSTISTAWTSTLKRLSTLAVQSTS